MPYNPGVTNRSGEIVGRAITDAAGKIGGSIVDAVDYHTREAKKFKALRAVAVDGYNMDPEEVDGMDPDELQGKLEGQVVKKHLAEQDRQAREQEMRMQQMAMALPHQQQRQDFDAWEWAQKQQQAQHQEGFNRDVSGAMSTADAMNVMGQAGGMATGVSVPRVGITPDVIMGAAAKNKALSPKDAMEMAERLQGGNMNYEEDPVSGMRFARSGRSVLPSGVNPAKVSPTPTNMTDAEGNPLTVFVNPRGGSPTIVRPKEAKDPNAVNTDDYTALLRQKGDLIKLKANLMTDKAQHPAIDAQVKEIDAQMARYGQTGKGAAAGGDKVMVISPDGKRGQIPKSQLGAAQKRGYKLAK